MPTVLRIGPYRFFFYSSDSEEPPHIHVVRDAAVAKFWLDPVKLCYRHGFRSPELRRIGSIISGRRVILLKAWHEHFGKQA